MTKRLEKTPDKQTLDQIKFYNDLRKSKYHEKYLSNKAIKQKFDILPYK
jgi:hypothetical protein